ncbi:hypothetical protein [Xanthomonas arboricola]|jgi:hypothetical protein|uniref:Uncharacterized protein n=1 Tax=Xanthomonas arboricola TaxID=56448 RepID=A0AB73H191_9XANT|nr:hypothetical protein [Xanthomonas arboricola]MBB3848023.1 hypothetical protein [Xanthomonas arboricola]MBB5672149.1 hypothetical protein [Xanthomonas arboricola]
MDNVKKVVSGWKALSVRERLEFDKLIEQIAEIENKSNRTFSEESIVKSHTVNFGPTGQGCPCCGR